jgi:hypothetical protein
MLLRVNKQTALDLLADLATGKPVAIVYTSRPAEKEIVTVETTKNPKDGQREIAHEEHVTAVGLWMPGGFVKLMTDHWQRSTFDENAKPVEGVYLNPADIRKLFPTARRVDSVQ